MDIIEKLKALSDNIQAAKLGKRGEKIHINSHTVIDEYQEWRTESEDLFEKYFDISNSHYKEFISLPRGGNGYVLMNYFDQQYPMFKVLIKKIELGETMKLTKKVAKVEAVKTDIGKTIFISHSTKDKEIIDAFVDIILHGALSVPIDKIFCVSTDGTKIKSGADWRDSINESLLTAKVNFLIITPNYKESEVCLNEMGAAWVTSATVLPLIIDPINYKTVGVIQEPNQIEKLLDEKSLDRIKDEVQEKLDIPPALIKSDRWTVKKTEFLIRVKKYLAANPFEIPMDRDAFNELIKAKADLEKTVNNLIEEKAELEILVKDLEKAKDKEEVKKAIKKHKPDSDYDEFVEVVEKAKKQLEKFSPIMRGIIFKEYTGKDIKINWEYYREDIDEAVAKDFVSEELNADWETTPEMQNIYETLHEISEILGRDTPESFNESFKRDFKAIQKLDNKTFWENVFDVAIYF
jgi:hypothetical protein